MFLRRALLAPIVAVALAAAACLALAAEAGPAAAENANAVPDQIVLSGDADVRRGEVAGEVIVFDGSATVAGAVRGDVIVLSGRILVSGQVSGDVICFDGPVILRPSAKVAGDVVASGQVTGGDRAEIGGRVRRGLPVDLRRPIAALGRFALWLAVSVSSLLLGLLLILLAPRGAEAIFRSAEERIGATIGWGLGLVVGLPVLAVLTIVTLVGIPFGLGLLLALAFVYQVGYAWGGWILGRWLIGPLRNRALTFLAGWVLLRAVAAIPFAGGITWIAGSGFGLGAVLVAVWRARTESPIPPAREPAAPPESVDAAQAYGGA